MAMLGPLVDGVGCRCAGLVARPTTGHGQGQSAELLMAEGGADVHLVDGFGESAIATAAAAGDLALSRQLQLRGQQQEKQQ